ncbi:phosphoenolpyruvate carboxykinase (ATP) [Streptomyces cinereoruber]|uniref:hypothetical protein n=1 Tax=Streptomyces cinereoruber TaxID=67260 RepID=UPI0036405468
MTDRTAIRIATADGQAVTVTSRSAAVTDWATQYFGSWWNAAPAEPPISGALVSADIDTSAYEDMAASVFVHGSEPDKTDYAGSPMLHARHGDGGVVAVQTEERLAYRWEPSFRRMRIAGSDETGVATAASRLAREVVRGMLLVEGWQILHASAVTRTDGATLLVLGDKGAGKTTTAFLLARAGWRLLANDRVFVRPEDGHVRVLPWPSAAACGFGLLDALGLFDPVAERLRGGQQMHPTQGRRVTDALLAGRREPLWKANGKEMKPRFFPDQLHTWLGMALATEGRAAGLLFPRIVASSGPRLVGEPRRLSEVDFLTSDTEDRYPDVFGLLPMTGGSAALVSGLSALPHQALALGRDTGSNAALLEKTAAGLID